MEKLSGLSQTFILTFNCRAGHRIAKKIKLFCVSRLTHYLIICYSLIEATGRLDSPHSVLQTEREETFPIIEILNVVRFSGLPLETLTTGKLLLLPVKRD